MTAAKPGSKPGTPPAKPKRRGSGRNAQGRKQYIQYDVSKKQARRSPPTSFYDGTQQSLEKFKRVWHLRSRFAINRSKTSLRGRWKTPLLSKSTDGGQNWRELSGLRGHGTAPSGTRRGGMLSPHHHSSTRKILIASTSPFPPAGRVPLRRLAGKT